MENPNCIRNALNKVNLPPSNQTFSQKLPDMDLGLEHPSRQLEIPRAQYCVLSTERIRLGRIPQGVVLSRVVSIRNCLAATVSVVSWDLQIALDESSQSVESSRNSCREYYTKIARATVEDSDKIENSL